MTKYSVIDLQGCSFMDDSWEEPMTANELRQRYWVLEECRTTYYKDFTMNHIQESWEVRFVKFGTKEWAEYNDSDIVDIIF